MPLDHEYLVPVGDIRGDTPQDIREAAIDVAVSDVPDAGARYEVVPGYSVGIPVKPNLSARGVGRLIGWAMVVRVSVPRSRASWIAPGTEPSTGRLQERRSRG